MKNLLLYSLILIMTGCAHFQPIKGSGRFVHMKDAYSIVFGQIDTPSPEACIVEAREFKKGIGLFNNADAECSDKSLEQEMPWLVTQSNVMTNVIITFRFRSRNLCINLANTAWKELSDDQKKIWTVSDCTADPSCDYCSGRPAKSKP